MVYRHWVFFFCCFQALADRIAVSCSLVRGEYNRAWNEVMLCEGAKVGEYKEKSVCLFVCCPELCLSLICLIPVSTKGALFWEYSGFFNSDFQVKRKRIHGITILMRTEFLFWVNRTPFNLRACSFELFRNRPLALSFGVFSFFEINGPDNTKQNQRRITWNRQSCVLLGIDTPCTVSANVEQEERQGW